MHILYLHGFASSPRSAKATFLAKLLLDHGHTVVVPDLNQPNFKNLSIQAILDHAASELQQIPAAEVLVIGSSLGGFTALQILGQKLAGSEKISSVVLLAPAFNFKHNKLLNNEVLAGWKARGEMPIYHSSTGLHELVHYQFIHEMELMPKITPPEIWTLIIHGIHDEIIAVQESRDFIKLLKEGQLLEVNSDHQLLNVLPQIGQSVLEVIAKGSAVRPSKDSVPTQI